MNTLKGMLKMNKKKRSKETMYDKEESRKCGTKENSSTDKETLEPASPARLAAKRAGRQTDDKETLEQAEKPSVKEESLPTLPTGKAGGQAGKEEVKAEPTLEEKYEELNDKFIRLHAEFDNYRKRTFRERIEFFKTASEDVIKSLLPVIDDFERAIKSTESGDDINTINEGVMLIYNKFKNILTQEGVEEIKTVGEIFNTDFHEAVTNITTEDEEMKGKVVDVVEKGYILNGKVIRFAKVVVGN